MKHLIKKISVANSDVIGHINFGNKKLALIAKNNDISSIYDGYEVYNFNYSKKSASNHLGVISALINEIGNKLDNKIVVYKDSWNSKYSFIDTIVPSLDKDKFIIRNKSKDLIDNDNLIASYFNIDNAINLKYLCKNLEVFKNKIKSIEDSVRDGVDIVRTLTHIKLVKTMWGSKKLQDIIDTVKDDFSEKTFNNNLDVSLEMLDKSVDRLIKKFGTDILKICEEEKKFIVSILIPNIIKNYENLKSLIMKLLSFLSTLVNLEKTFETNIKCPVSWFINNSDITSANDIYKELINFIIQIPAIESKLIDPLDFYRLQLLSEIKESTTTPTRGVACTVRRDVRVD